MIVVFNWLRAFQCKWVLYRQKTKK